MVAALIGYYTITPTHCGTGQAADAVDLPIAREAHTKHPIFPATSLKGSMRERFEQEPAQTAAVERWFGPRLEGPGGDGNHPKQLSAGSMTFGEGRLLAFPVRCLHSAFCYVTSPLVVERFERDLHAFGLSRFWGDTASSRADGETWRSAEALVTPELFETLTTAGGMPLVLEDLVFDANSQEVQASPNVGRLAQTLERLLPDNEKATRKRLRSQLVVLREDYFADLLRRTTPVSARVALGENKTTTDGGNLWYEETLPPDTLLASFVTLRRTRSNGDSSSGSNASSASSASSGSNASSGSSASSASSASSGSNASSASSASGGFFDALGERTERPLQIGGNETVGQGLCLWHVGGRSDG